MLITGPGGRKLDVDVQGPSHGDWVLFHHGTPSTGQLFAGRTRAGADRGLRHVSYSRPGYAHSDRHAGRTIADCAADVAAVADALAIERLFVVGLSGGGPHALACAALLGDRVIAAATIGSVAPFAADGLSWFEGMGEENLEEFQAMQAGDAELAAFLERMRGEFGGEMTGERVREAFGDLLSDVDRATLSGEFADFMAGDTGLALRHGIDGWLDDDIAFFGDWGFDVAAIDRPVTIWQGRQDRFVPYAHGEWLAAHVSGAHAELHEDEGHLSLSVGDGYGRVLDRLLADRD